MDRPIDTAAAQQRRVGGVDNRVRRHRGDVGPRQFDLWFGAHHAQPAAQGAASKLRLQAHPEKRIVTELTMSAQENHNPVGESWQGGARKRAFAPG
jgi:hypothetical protein